MPDAEPDQPEHEIPVDPKMSNVPGSNAKIKEEKPSTSLLVPITQEDEIMPTVLEVQKQDKPSATATDTLKLEQNKKLPSPDSAKTTPNQEQSQSEPQKQESF